MRGTSTSPHLLTTDLAWPSETTAARIAAGALMRGVSLPSASIMSNVMEVSRVTGTCVGWEKVQAQRVHVSTCMHKLWVAENAFIVHLHSRVQERYGRDDNIP